MFRVVQKFFTNTPTSSSQEVLSISSTEFDEGKITSAGIKLRLHAQLDELIESVTHLNRPPVVGELSNYERLIVELKRLESSMNNYFVSKWTDRKGNVIITITIPPKESLNVDSTSN